MEDQNKKEGRLRLFAELFLVALVTATLVGGMIYWQLSKVTKAQNEYINSLKDEVETLSGKLLDVSFEDSVFCLEK